MLALELANRFRKTRAQQRFISFISMSSTVGIALGCFVLIVLLSVMNGFEKSWGTVTWEEVVAQNPEVIIIVNYGSVTAEQKRAFMMSNPAFANIEAVKNDRFVTLEYVEATPGPRNINAVKTLLKAFWGS